VNPSWLVLAAAGLAVLSASTAGARRPTIPDTGSRVFPLRDVPALRGIPALLTGLVLAALAG
jgi:hypothetical protein